MIYIIFVLIAVIVLWLWFIVTNSEKETMDDMARQAADGGFIRLSDGWTHYELSGPADGIPVVLLPGGTLQQFVWDNNIQALTDAGYRVLRYDLFGRGLSDKPRKAYDRMLFERQLTELLDKLGIKQPVHLVGLALGGLIAAQYAEAFPERVRSLTLITPDGFGTHLSIGAQLSRLPLLGAYLGHVLGNAIMLKRLDDFSPNLIVVNELKQKFLPHLRQKGFKYALRSTLSHMPIHTSGATFARLESNKLPTLVVWGENDMITPLDHLDQILQIMPSIEQVVLPGSGHMPQYEKPAVFNNRLLQFLDKYK